MRRCLGICLPLALALASCGGGDSGSSNSTLSQTPQKAAFISKADKACYKANTKVFPINVQIQELNKRQSSGLAKKVAPLYAKAQRIGRQVLVELRALQPPTADSAAYRAYLAAAEKQVSLVGSAQRALERNDKKAVTDLSAKAAAARARAQGLARAFGFKVCSST
jgi:hypothetical protein